MIRRSDSFAELLVNMAERAGHGVPPWIQGEKDDARYDALDVAGLTGFPARSPGFRGGLIRVLGGLIWLPAGSLGFPGGPIGLPGGPIGLPGGLFRFPGGLMGRQVQYLQHALEVLIADQEMTSGIHVADPATGGNDINRDSLAVKGPDYVLNLIGDPGFQVVYPAVRISHDALPKCELLALLPGSEADRGARAAAPELGKPAPLLVRSGRMAA